MVQARAPMQEWTRRDFLGRAAGGAAALLGSGRWLEALPSSCQEKPRRSVADRVGLGNTKLTITKLGIGTGTGNLQRNLGQEGFTRLVRHAYDAGLRYIDTADAYKMHAMVGKAIQGLPREELVILSKIRIQPEVDVAATLDRFRKELDTDYLDIVLIHCARKATWPADLAAMRDGLSAAKDKGFVRAVGVSCHGLPSLRAVAANGWVQVNLARINHRGDMMDGTTGKWKEPGLHSEGVAEIKKIHDSGKGVIGMKIFAEGAFRDPDEREKSIQFVVKSGCVDAMTIGFGSTREIDETIERIHRALNG